MLTLIRRLASLSVPAALALGIAPALAADPPAVVPVAVAPPASVFDVAFGAKIQSDYNFRGISQTDRRPGVAGYVELQAFENLLYAGIAGYSVDLATRPAAEVDLTLGVRPKLGPFTFDFGAIFYWYPDERQYIDAAGTIWTPRNTDFTELAAKVVYNHGDKLLLGANLFHAWDWLGSGATGTYASVTAKWNLPFLEGLALSGELGHYWLGTTSAYLGGLNLPDYTYWNAGLAYTFKTITLDLRYHDTDLSKQECFALTADPRGIVSGSGRSRWCSQTFIASLSVDLTASSLGVFAPR
ncbi:MAG TPA: TorF family putative porin [Salinarimonas sp.]|nr:TorF family putative porin [Salinarimonas sp.]